MSEFQELKARLLGEKGSSQSSSGSGPCLSSGLTLLNLAIAGHPTKAIAKGTYILFVGDSASGKTFLALQILAEANRNKEFAGYDLYYDAAEFGARMNLAHFFGHSSAKRIKQPKPPTTVEQWYDMLDDRFKHDKPFIAVLDSMDALRSEASDELFQAGKDARRRGKEAPGSYATDKSKANSANMNRVVAQLAETGSILIIVSQTRDNIGFGSQYNPKTRSGGKALRFYATAEAWFSIKKRITKTVRGKPRPIGTLLQIQVKKNRETGREPKIEIPFYPAVGWDDTGSMVRWLVEEKHWPDRKGVITAEGLGVSGTLEKVIGRIEGTNREKELKKITAELWSEIDGECKVERKRRYV